MADGSSFLGICSSLFREEGYPTIYDGLRNQIWLDVTVFRLCFLFTILVVSFLCILPGFRGIKRLYVFVRWMLCFIIGFLIIACNLLPYWEVANLDVRTAYRAGSSAQINATVGLRIGLRGLNITLKGQPIDQHGDVIDYNERFTWTWLQGKPGFGFDAGTFHKQYRNAQLRGLPYPILWIAETFTIDYEHVRIGRYYRQAGWYAHVFMWLAVPLFILANILFQMVIQYGSLYIIFTGISLLTANLIVTLLRSSVLFRLAFQSMNSNEMQHLMTHFSWCYYVNLINGFVCIVLGLVTLFADLRFPDEIAEFFGNSILQSYEDYFADPHDKPVVETNGFARAQAIGDNEIYLRKKNQLVRQESGELAAKSGLKKRSISVRFQKSTIRKVVVPQVELREDCDQLAKEAKAMLGPRESIDFPSPPPQPVQFDTISEEEEDESDYQLPQVNSSSVHHHQ